MENIALWYRRFGQPIDALTLETAVLDPLRPSAVRVRMTAAPVNPSDLIPITGAYRHRIRPPQIAGYEGIGTVVAAEGEAAALIGRRVMPLRGPGTWQRYVDCDPAWMVAVPDDLDAATAARGYINPLAAMLMLREQPLTGRSVLVTAAGSTCAALLAQWAFEAGAREVVGVYRAAGHVAHLSGLGIEPVGIGASAEIAAAAVRADLAFDAVGGPLGTRIIGNMRPDATFISYGLLSGETFTVPRHGPRLRRFHLRDRLATVEQPVWQGWFRELWPLLRRASMPDAAYFPLSDWREALAFFRTSGRQAKPILNLQ